MTSATNRGAVRQQSAALDERFLAEFYENSAQLLTISTRLPAALLDAGALQFDRPEPPRPPDLPVLPAKRYPRMAGHAQATILDALRPLPPIAGFTGRKTELDQTISALLLNKQVILTGEARTGRTALIRAAAHDPRITRQFRQVWMIMPPLFGSLTNPAAQIERIAAILTFALNIPHVLMVERTRQPVMLREALDSQGVLLTVDVPSLTPEALEYVTLCSGRIAVVLDQQAADSPDYRTAISPYAARVRVAGFAPDTSMALLDRGKQSGEVRALADLIGHHPYGVMLLRGLLVEDEVPAIVITESIREMSSRDRLRALEQITIAALPAEYRELADRIGSSAGDSQSWLSLAETKSNPVAMIRAVTFLHKRGLIERRGESGMEVRAIGTWAEAAESVESSDPFADLYDQNADAAESDTQIEAILQAIDKDPKRDSESLFALESMQRVQANLNERYQQARTLSIMARIHYLQGEEGAAIKDLDAAFSLLTALRDEAALKVVRIALSRVYRQMGRYDQALSILNAPDGLIDADEQAQVYAARTDWNEVQNVYLRMLKQTDDPGERAQLRLQMGAASLAADKPRDTLTMLEDLHCLSADQQIERQWLIAQAHHLRGAPDLALNLYDKLSDDAPNAMRAPLARAASKARALSGDVESALLGLVSEGVFYEARLPRPAFARGRISHALAAHLYFMTGQIGDANTAAKRGLDLPGEKQDFRAESICYRVLGRAAWGSGHTQDAIHYFEQELNARVTVRTNEKATEKINDAEIAYTLHNIGKVYSESDDHERAATAYRRALKAYDVSRSSSVEANAANLLTLLALRESLIALDRVGEAYEVGTMAYDQLSKMRPSDLLTHGYTLIQQAHTAAALRKPDRARSLLIEWIDLLNARMDEAAEHPHSGLRVCAASLAMNTANTSQLTPVQRIDTAESALTIIERDAPDTLAAWGARRDLGLTYLALSQAADARDILLPLLRLPPEQAPFILLAAHLGLARSAIQRGDSTEALAHYTEAVQFEPDRAAQGRIWREAVEPYSQANDLAAVTELMQRAALAFHESNQRPEYVESIVALGYARLRSRDYGVAIDTLEEAYRVADESRNDPAETQILKARVLFDMAEAHLTLGQTTRAVERFRASLALQDIRRDPELYTATLIAVARVSRDLGQLDESLRSYWDVLRGGELTPEVRRTLLIEQAMTFKTNNQPDDAANSFTAAREIEGASTAESAIIERGLGEIYTRRGDHAQAREHFSKVLATAADSEDDAATWEVVAEGHLAQDQKPEAAKTYEKALSLIARERDPGGYARVATQLGKLYMDLNHITDAIRHLTAAYNSEKLLPTQSAGRIVTLLELLADSYERRGDPAQAAVRLHESLVYQDVRHAPEPIIVTLLKLGRLYFGMEKYPDAVTSYEKAGTVESKLQTPSRARIEERGVGLGDTYLAMGRLEWAADQYRSIAKSMTATPYRDRARELLRTCEAEIARSVAALETVEMSRAVLERNSRAELDELAFVYAQEAQILYKLGRWEEAQAKSDELIALLRSRRADLQKGEKRAALLTLTAWLQAHEAGDESDRAGYLQRARDQYAAESRRNPALVWLLERPIE